MQIPHASTPKIINGFFINTFYFNNRVIFRCITTGEIIAINDSIMPAMFNIRTNAFGVMIPIIVGIATIITAAILFRIFGASCCVTSNNASPTPKIDVRIANIDTIQIMF